MILLSNYNQQENLALIYLIFINLAAFFIYAYDKSQARRKKSRISENLLLFIALIGGATGALMGMVVFKHKLSKKIFYLGVPVLIILNRILSLTILNYIK